MIDLTEYAGMPEEDIRARLIERGVSPESAEQFARIAVGRLYRDEVVEVDADGNAVTINGIPVNAG
jgi:hypothetical protein